MGLSQDKIGKLLMLSQSPEETEEVLMAYLYNKWVDGGNQPQVLRKLHLLTLYLRAVDLGPLLLAHYSAFAIAASLTKSHARPIVVLPSSALGIEAWNAARRPSKSVFKRALRPFSSSGRVNPGLGSSESSDAEEEGEAGGGAGNRGGGEGRGGRSRSSSWGGGGLGGLAGLARRSKSTTTLTAVIVQPGERGEEQRRLAGAGARDGLGSGLLSAPPNYDGGLARYLDSEDPALPSAIISSRPYDPERDVLPDYA
ncbi:hypothetical protein JCM21900_006552 [Sporobolomyces salmonicolor]